MTRDRLNHERVEALIEVLVAQGTISRDWADALEQTRELGEGSEVAKAARKGRKPPDFGREGGNE